MDYKNLADDYARNRKPSVEVLDEIRRTGGVGADSSVLEVGCGTGNYIIALDEAADCSSWGVDPPDAMLAYARKRSRRVRFSAGTAAHLAFPDDRFDLLYSVDVIHHVEQRDRFFSEAHRVLKPGGLICTLTHSEAMLRNSASLGRYFPETIQANLDRYPPVSELLSLMQTNGFREIEERALEYSVSITDSRTYAEKAYSPLHQISDEAFARGLARLKRDLAKGPITGIRRHLAIWGKK